MLLKDNLNAVFPEVVAKGPSVIDCSRVTL